MSTPNTPSTATTQASEATSPSIRNSDKIQWADTETPVSSAELQEQFEVARARNWISDRLIAQSQRHWHCTRDQAIHRLLAQHI